MQASTFSHSLNNMCDFHTHVFTHVPDIYFPDLPICESVLVTQFYYKSNATRASYSSYITLYNKTTCMLKPYKIAFPLV